MSELVVFLIRWSSLLSTTYIIWNIYHPMAKENTTEKGNELRDRVYKLCVAAGMRNVKLEHAVGGKKADVYFEDVRGFDGVKRFAVECKHYARPLGEQEWGNIYSGYCGRRKDFDRLLIISEMGVTRNFSDGVEANREWITQLTWQQFLFSLIDFHTYFKSLSLLNHDDNLDQYYVLPLDTNGQDLEVCVNAWLAGKSNQPLAFLAGYGMGKSSLAKYLASTMAPKFQDGTFSRIPVYIKLGNLYDQQNIDSLITHYFSSEHQIASMTPTLFKEMNRLGLLFIIFDGFDEMKHGMTHRDFKHIFSQIKELVKGEARVMVLGRPSALTSNSDRSVLFGKEETRNEILSALNDEVTFKEIHIAEFNDEQLNSFVPSFLNALNRELQNKGNDALLEDALSARAQDVLAMKFRTLIRRPVHAQMLCRIALLKPNVKLTQTSTYQLYQSFVVLILEREVGKQARKAIDEQQRLSFIMDTAWHFWPDKGLTGFTLEQLKGANVSLPEKERPNDDIHREMLVGSLLEKKAGSLYYFSHRSFQEYLVAQYIITSPTLINEIEKINVDITSEILVFIQESVHADEVAKKVFDALSSLRKPINSKLLEIFETIDLNDFLKQINFESISALAPKQCFIYAEMKYRHVKEFVKLEQLHNDECRAAALLGIVNALKGEFAGPELKEILGLLLYFSKPFIQKADSTRNKLRNQIVLRCKEQSMWARAFLTLKSSFNGHGEFISIGIEPSLFFNSINEQILISDIVMKANENRVEVNALDILLQNVINKMDGKGTVNDYRHTEYRKELIHFLRTHPSHLSFVFDQSKPIDLASTKQKRTTLSLKK